MPYLKLTCPAQSPDRYAAIAERLTQAVNDLFYNPRARLSRDELRQRTTVHFVPYAEHELFIGGQTPTQRGARDITAELSDWSMSVRQQRRIARALTSVLADVFGVDPAQLDNVNIRFHAYPPTDFSVGGQLLADRVPLIGRLMKRLLG